MFDIGWTELVMIGVVALIVIGPKDLPDMFRTLGRFTAKMRSMAREFQRAMETAANESGMKDVAKDLKAAASPQSMGLNAMKDAAAKFEKWDPLKPKPAAPASPPAAVPEPAVPARGPATEALAKAQAERKAIAADAAAKMKAVGKPAADAAPETAAVPAKPKRAAKAAPPPAAPKKPRKAASPKSDA